MSTEKKVLFLFLSLVILIVTCVFTHVGDFKVEEDSTVKTSIESDSPSILGEITQKVKSFISTPEEEITQENVSQEVVPVMEKTEETSSPEKIEENKIVQDKLKDELNSTNETIPSEQKSDEATSSQTSENQNIEKTEEVVEEEKKIEEPIKPLVTTDVRYKRTGDEKNIEDLSKEAQLLQIKMSEYVKENPIIFKRGSNKITKSSNRTIKTVVEALKEFPSMKIEVAGHTDAIGAAKLNKTISEQRAISVKKRLVYYGIEVNRIKARGYGENIPLVKNSKNGYSKINRRVEFNIVEE